MADPICRWRNPYIKTIRELLDVLPTQIMDETNARNSIEGQFSGFFTTAYQTAVQLGLYAFYNGVYYPRFLHAATIDEIEEYCRNWMRKYYVPNPYTKQGFQNTPIITIIDGIGENYLKGEKNWNNIKNDIFKETIGNDDILINTINTYSSLFSVKSGTVTLKENVRDEDISKTTEDLGMFQRNDKRKFFNRFSLPHHYEIPANGFPKNLILYGAPGTGKSYLLNERAKPFGNRIKRVTFYPDYSYSKFVGSYKPNSYYKETEDITYHRSRNGGDKLDFIKAEPIIDYSYVPGPLVEAIISTLKSDEPYLLIIEEINRANAASVFGEVFQLLDRKEGKSEYTVILSKEAMDYIKSELGSKASLIDNGIFLPENLHIWATMNSADQGVFYMDAAFKRRWQFEYMPLNSGDSVCIDRVIKYRSKDYLWNIYRKEINAILSELKIPEDRLLGPFFLNEEELKDEKSVKNKLFVYLRDDVLRHSSSKFFKYQTFSEIDENYNSGVFQDHIEDRLAIAEKK